MATEQRVQILINEETAYGHFCDAIYFTPEEHAALSKDDIAALAKARVDGYVALVEAASNAPAVPDAVALSNEAEDVRRRIEDLNARMKRLSTDEAKALTASAELFDAANALLNPPEEKEK